MANNLMTDVLGLFLTLLGMERLAAWPARRRWHEAVVAGISLGLAPLARPHLLALPFLAALLLLDGFSIRGWIRQIRSNPWRWMPVWLALATFVLIAAIIREPTRGFRGVSPVLELSFSSMRNSLAAYFVYLAIPVPFAIPWIALHWRHAKILAVAPAVMSLIMLARYLWLSPNR